MARWLAALVAALLASCDEAPAIDVDRPRAEEPLREAEVSLDEPPPLPGTVEACAEALARRTPREVSATLDDLQYDTVFLDACIATRAEADRTAALCA